MAEAKTKQEATHQQGLQRQDRSGQNVQRWSSVGSPFEFMDRVTEEMDRAFDRMFQDLGLPRRSWSRGFGTPAASQGTWMPRVEAFQKGDQFIVRAELPGMNKDDVQVELTDDAVTIHGERKQEHEENREGYFHSEREYGHFYRSIPLPEGVIGESANASFKDGVLEVTMKAAPAEANRGRKLEIK